VSAPRVAFQGELGAFSEEAVRRFFGPGAEPVPRREFAEVGRAVAGGEVDFGLLPIENTLAGSVIGSYDVLAAEPLEVVGEVITPIHHCVLGVEGASVEGLSRVLSHPVALAQCTRFLARHPAIEAVAVYDTAGAALEVARQRDPTLAAIAGRRAAGRYELSVLAADVEDRHDNQTRFLVVAREGAPRHAGLPRPEGPRRSALLVETPNSPGALVRVLLPFSEAGINLSKLESRPTGEPWSYRFFVELDESAEEPAASAALERVAEHASRLRVLGSYARWREPGAETSLTPLDGGGERAYVSEDRTSGPRSTTDEAPAFRSPPG
jgi:prephenate dehydratase/chorismate mutase/prephenate dehydratase